MFDSLKAVAEKIPQPHRSVNRSPILRKVSRRGLYEELGIPDRMPAIFQMDRKIAIVGYEQQQAVRAAVFVSPRYRTLSNVNQARRAHRVFCNCPICGAPVPLSRIHQHYKSDKCLEMAALPRKPVASLNPHRLVLDLPLPNEFLEGILTTVVETPFGDWFQWEMVSRTPRENDLGGMIYRGKVEYDAGDGTTGTYDVTLVTIAEGLRRILSKRMVHAEITGAIMAACLEHDAGMIDSIAADAILQAAIFNNVVFG